MKNNLITIKTSPAKLTADFEAAEKYLKTELQKYDVVVTLETLPGSKELAKELNKIAGDIDAKRKEAVSDASEPIKAFDEKMKLLVNMCKNGRVKILEQIKVFEDDTRKKIEIMLHDLRAELWRMNEVKDEFLSAEFDDLVLLSNMTKAGSLAGKAKSELKHRVLADKSKQDKIERRLLELENASYKAGLSAPLTRVHVSSFLYATDEVYCDNLEKIIASEKERQAITEEAIRKRTLKESSQDTQPQQPENLTATEVSERMEKPVYKKPAAKPGMKIHVIKATFEVPVPDNIDVSRVVDKLKKVMLDAGITTLKNIEVVA